MKWINVKEKMPDRGDFVIGVITERGNLVTEVTFWNGIWYFADDYCGGDTTEIVQCQVTHWMPLPEPPELS
jgi:hypothetical protein